MIVLDANGRIDGLRPGDPGFLARALQKKRRFILVKRGERPGVRRTLNLPGGGRLLYYIVPNSTLAALLRTNPNNTRDGKRWAFFSSPEANPDQVQHAKLRPARNGKGETMLSWEDLWGGGDRDFDDLVLSLRFVTRTGNKVRHQL